MIKLHKIIFFSLLIFSTMLSISAYSWMSMWMGLEINLFSMIPLMCQNKNILSSEAIMKYFIAQAIASSMLMFALIIIMNLNEFMPENLNKIMILIMNTSLLMKLGAAPFHSWFPEVMEGLTWMNCLLMMTWQKLAPLILLMYNLTLPIFITTIILVSSIIGGIMGINQISLRKILSYSSINHLAWMLSSMLNFKIIWLVYFLIYSIISINIILILKLYNIFYTKQFFLIFNNKILNMIFSLNFLSLGGLPPFLGFLPKWLTITNMVENNFIILSIMLILTTLITLFFYIRLILASFMLMKMENLYFLKNKTNLNIMLINLFFLMSFPIFLMFLA